MKQPKTYHDSFKRKVVGEVLRGSTTKEAARKRYGIGGKSTILDWMRKQAGYKTKQAGVDPIPKLKNMSKEENAQLKEQIQRLQAELEYATLTAQSYRKLVEFAREHYQLDLEKKRGAKQSESSNKSFLK